MKILLLSDTHSHYDAFMEKYILQADEVWHAGDIGNLEVTDRIAALKPLRAVYGNIDDDKALQVNYTATGTTVILHLEQ